MTTAARTHPALLAPRVAGRPLAWARDMAFVGATTSAFAPWAAGNLAPSGYWQVSAVVGLVTGALLGLAMPALIDLVRGRVPLLLLVLGSVLLGAAWGGLTGGLAGLAFGGISAQLGVVAGAAAGGFQLGWFWFPYTFQSVRGGRTWPLLLTSLLTLPVATAAAVYTTLFLAMPMSMFG